jgi:hypothetical protein
MQVEWINEHKRVNQKYYLLGRFLGVLFAAPSGFLFFSLKENISSNKSI